MVDYAGVLIMLALALLFVGALFALQQRLAPRGRAADASRHRSAAHGPEAARPDDRWRPAALDLYPLALLFSVCGVLLAVFFVTAPLLRELAGPGLRVLSIFALPVLVGLLYEWRKGVFKW